MKLADETKQTRAIKYLLIKGAKTDIRDKKGQTAEDLLKNFRNRKTSKEIKAILVISLSFINCRIEKKVVPV